MPKIVVKIESLIPCVKKACPREGGGMLCLRTLQILTNQEGFSNLFLSSAAFFLVFPII